MDVYVVKRRSATFAQSDHQRGRGSQYVTYVLNNRFAIEKKSTFPNFTWDTLTGSQLFLSENSIHFMHNISLNSIKVFLWQSQFFFSQTTSTIIHIILITHKNEKKTLSYMVIAKFFAIFTLGKFSHNYT